MESDALIGPDGKVDLRDTNVVESWLCIDCGYNTAPGMFGRVELQRAFEANGGQGVNQTIDKNSEVYFVRNAIWTKAGMQPWGGCLCIGCLEKRLGRKLKPKDFDHSHLFNSSRIPGTHRLLDRRGRRKVAFSNRHRCLTS